VKDLINYDWIHSLDRLEIAEALNLLLEKANRTVQALIQVNIGGEATKSGIAENDLESFIERVSNLKNIKLRGLMAMVPALNPVEQRRSYFKKMKSLLKQHQSIPSFDSLSMGTSEDYKIAIEEGATYIRLGTVLFGNRI
jgi:pyridoxal phosphate enzyme (YggS family)